jgi:alpha-mannosidase
MLIYKAEEAIQKHLEFCKSRCYQKLAQVELSYFKTGKHLRSFPENQAWEKTVFPFAVGKEKQTIWFQGTASVGQTLPGRLFFHCPFDCESNLLVNKKHHTAIDAMHQESLLDNRCVKGRRYHCALETYSGHWIPSDNSFAPYSAHRVMLSVHKMLPGYPAFLNAPWLVVEQKIIKDFYYDCLALYKTAQQLPGDSLRKTEIIRGLYGGFMCLRFENPSSQPAAAFESQIAAARKIIAPLLNKKNGPTTPHVYMVGHAHIDHAWLWPMAETTRKVSRTFSSMLAFCREFKEFRFIQSQPAQIEMLAEHYPGLFKEVQAA